MSKTISLRDRTIRLVAASAVCGLSFSYLASEGIDRALRTSFQEQIEISFPVIMPVLAAENFFNSDNNLVISQNNKTNELEITPIYKEKEIAANEAEMKNGVQQREVIATKLIPITVAAPVALKKKYKIQTLASNILETTPIATDKLEDKKNAEQIARPVAQPKRVKLVKAQNGTNDLVSQPTLLDKHDQFVFDYPSKQGLVIAAELTRKEKIELAELAGESVRNPQKLISIGPALREVEVVAENAYQPVAIDPIEELLGEELPEDEYVALDLSDDLEMPERAQSEERIYADNTETNEGITVNINEPAAQDEVVTILSDQISTIASATAKEIKKAEGVNSSSKKEKSEAIINAEAQTPANKKILGGPVDLAEYKPKKIETTVAYIESPKISIAVENKTNEIKLNKKRIIGSLLGELPMKGHFEIGIYERIDERGLPIGYPMALQVMRKGEGKFQLRIPKEISSGFVFARYVRKNNEKWFKYPGNPIQNLQEVETAQITIPLRLTDKVKTIAAAEIKEAETKSINLEGRIENGFASGNAITGAKIKIRGTKIETTSGADGKFSLQTKEGKGAVLLEVSAPGYMPAVERVRPEAGTFVTTQLYARDAIDRMAYSLGIRQESDRAVLLVKVADSAALGGIGSGIKSRLSLAAQGPYYFKDSGYPVVASELNNFGKDGRAIYFNVVAGEASLELYTANESMAPIVINSLGSGQMIQKNLILREQRVGGRVFRAIPEADGKLPPLVSARVHTEGSSKWTNTDSYGAFELPEMIFALNETVLLEVAQPGYQKHRYSIQLRGENKQRQDLFAFPQDYIMGLVRAAEIESDERVGYIMGSVGTGKKIRVDALADQSSINNTRDFYFSKGNTIRGAYSATDPNLGTYFLANVPTGRVLLLGQDERGEVNYADVAHVQSSSVTVVTQD